jgi:hypothetical protein
MAVRDATQKGWEDTLAPYGGNFTDGIDEDTRRFNKICEYENSQLDTELLPAYRFILERFETKYWLSEPRTREFYERYYSKSHCQLKYGYTCACRFLPPAQISCARAPGYGRRLVWPGWGSTGW